MKTVMSMNCKRCNSNTWVPFEQTLCKLSISVRSFLF